MEPVLKVPLGDGGGPSVSTGRARLMAVAAPGPVQPSLDNCAMAPLHGQVTIITTDANAMMAELHNRMPVGAGGNGLAVWLGEAEGDPKSLLRPAAEGALRVWPVSRDVNTPRNNGPDVLAPLVDADGDGAPAGPNPA